MSLIKVDPMMNIDRLHLVRTPADEPGCSGRGWCGAGESGGTGVYFSVKSLIKSSMMMNIDRFHMIWTPTDASGSSGRGWLGTGESGGTGVQFTTKF